MANWNNQYNEDATSKLRKSASGDFLSSLEAKAQRAKFSAETRHASTDDREVVSTELDVASDSPVVQSYVQPIIDLIRKQTNPRALRELVPMIQEVLRTAQMDDPTLKKTEKDRIVHRLQELLRAVEHKSSIFTRLKTKALNVVKPSEDMRTELAERFATGHGLLGKLASTALKPRPNIGDSIAATRAGIYNNVAQHYTTEMAKPGTPDKPIRNLDVETLTPEEKESKKKTVRVPTPKTVEPTATVVKASADKSTATLTAILTTDKSILKELQSQTKLQQDAAELNAQNAEAKERSAIEGKTTPSATTSTTIAPVKLDKGRTLFSDIGNMFSGLPKIVTTAMEGLGLMGKGALVIGAAWAGWKVGSWISQMVGLGDSSQALKNLLDTSQESYKDTGKAIIKGVTGGYASEVRKSEDFEFDLAKKHGFQAGPFETRAHALDRARKINNDVAHPPSPVTAATAENVAGSLSVVPTIAPALKTSLSPEEVPPTPSAAPTPPERPVGENVAKAKITEMSANGMRVLQHGIGKKYGGEGFLPTPKLDGDSYAIGFGMHTWQGKPVTKDWPSKVTEAEATAEMKRQMQANIYPRIMKDIHRPLNQAQFDSMASFMWNVGAGKGWQNMAKHVNEGTATPEYFQRTATVKGVRNEGLSNRRNWEAMPFGDDKIRAATPVDTLTKATRSPAPTVVIAPSTTVAHNGGGGTAPMPIIQPIQPRNKDDVLNGITGTNHF
jgi:GH24 family phage-related lysozyme (muramidase)